MKASLVSAAALCMVSGLAMAQSADCGEGAAKAGECEVMVECVGEGAQADGTYELKASVEDNGQLSLKLQRVGEMLAGAVAAGQPEVQSRMVMIQKDDDHEVKVELDGDQVKAWVDGKEVPKKRLKISDEKIRVLDGEGETIAEFGRHADVHFGTVDGADRQFIVKQLRGGPDGPIVWEGEGGEHLELRNGPGGDGGMFFTQPEGEHPSVLIGIAMGSLDQAEVDDRVFEMLADRDIDEGDVFVVQNVIDGTPADDAGLREGDVVVRVDGKWGVGTEKLRDVLMDKEPGDTLELAVIRKGKLREVEVELAAWSDKVLGGPVPFQWQEQLPGMLFEQREGGDIQALIEGLRSRQGELGGDLQKQYDVIIKQLGEDGDGGLPELDVRPRIQLHRLGEDGQPQMLVRPAPAQRGAPRPDAAPDAQARLERIEARLERLEHQLDRLINAMQNRERDED